MRINLIARDIIPGPIGPALLLLHAYPFDHRMWLPTVDRLAGVPILLVDAPGFGESEPSVDTPSLDAFADEIVAGLGKFGVERIVPVGNSMGGYVALALLERHPDLVAGLGMIGTRADADSVDAKAGRFENLVTMLAGRREELLTPQVEAMFTDSTRRARPEVVAQAVEWSKDASDAGLSWAQRAMAARPDRLHLLTEFNKPVLVMRGDSDNVSPAEASVAMAQAAGTEVVEVHQTSHLVPIENPGAVSRHLMTLYPQCM
ncbi:MAG: alpha/beta hydrolase [Mobiluncus porci]|uniref:alpha/beta fold hydrolase n=1 Tax=Mobiluncus TaxID=2050 RepID=UPI0023F11952|nr:MULTISPECIES: alpha/beta hydrolase [Mobiluncus]MCI6584088.1 alpha/beta hydrolase [Mobiluncus sp.]MDD7541605.1 alpha/beta hydrolase [Mobiluncus porci]MDY5748354.1 alpha/beta hydrolase [Mobiluncus porci]